MNLFQGEKKDVFVFQSILHHVTVQTVVSQKPERQSRDVGPVINLPIILNEMHPGRINSGFCLWRYSVVLCVLYMD